MMIENTFSNDETAITPADIDSLELAIGHKVPDLSPQENQAKAEQPVCSNFTRFVQGLIDEDDIDEE